MDERHKPNAMKKKKSLRSMCGVIRKDRNMNEEVRFQSWCERKYERLSGSEGYEMVLTCGAYGLRVIKGVYKSKVEGKKYEG